MLVSMDSVDTGEEEEAVTEEMADDNNDDIMEGANNMDDMDDDTDDHFDWEKIMHDAENAEDDSSNFDMEEDEEVPTDDDLSEYVCDDDIKDDDYSIENIKMLPRGYRPDASPINELSEDSKALLFWRDEENDKCFSDWKIKVEAHKSDDGKDDCSEESAAIYNVHRFAIALGPKKSGYFEALLQSDCYRENSDCVSTVKLPEKVAKQFPDFLDYLYAQPLESNFVINFENWESMKYLADYFLVPRLTEAVAEFIEEDMKYFDLDHMEKYISVFHRDISDDMSRRILPQAVRVCAQMFLSIEIDSPLLMSIPPAMFRAIMRGLSWDDNQETLLHTCSLLAAYLERNVEDRVVFDFCCDVSIEPKLFFLDVREDATIEVVLTWYRLMAKRELNGPFEYADLCHMNIELVFINLADITCKYLRSKTPSIEMMEKIVRDAPNDVVAKAVRLSLDEARRPRESGDD
ncbi:hypothetical protein ACHAWT_000484 [Skeletonema menzelii]